MKCGTLDTGEFIEGFCQHPEQIEYWKRGITRFGKLVHHISGDHNDNRPENRMTCHFGCHISFHKRTKLHAKGTTTMGIEVDLYRRLHLIKRIGNKSVVRLEAIKKVIERLLDFYFANGGEELEAEYKLKELEEG